MQQTFKIQKKTPIPEYLFNNLARLSHKCFPLNFKKFLRTSFYRIPPAADSEIVLEYCNHHRADSLIIL